MKKTGLYIALLIGLIFAVQHFLLEAKDLPWYERSPQKEIDILPIKKESKKPKSRETWYERAARIPKKKENVLYQSLKKILPKYTQKKNQVARTGISGDSSSNADVSAIKESSEMHNILVLLSEIPRDGKAPIIAPVFVADHKNIFGTRTDFSFSWVGYKVNMKFKQNNFPWKNTSLQESLIGSFVHASGTNLGFIENKMAEERRFYTNYTSEIMVLRWKMFKYLSTGYGLDSRQYFFKKRNTPPDFIMPENHINIFPEFMCNIGSVSEKGIDQLTSGIQLSGWTGYGIRNKWQAWGEPDNLQSSEAARTFMIYETLLTVGLLFAHDQNIILRVKYKGGVDNDFLSRPRFGATIDNANLDVVHGFTLDEFRVYKFSLANLQYGISLGKWFRFRLFLDYARIFSPEKTDLFGSGYGIRLITIGGLPIWFTHGFGRQMYPELTTWRQTMMIMSAAGW